jgi:hypothetical protein
LHISILVRRNTASEKNTELGKLYKNIAMIGKKKKILLFKIFIFSYALTKFRIHHRRQMFHFSRNC